jgi:hypothetical protein
MVYLSENGHPFADRTLYSNIMVGRIVGKIKINIFRVKNALFWLKIVYYICFRTDNVMQIFAVMFEIGTSDVI